MYTQKIRHKRGFTLVELIVIVVIIGILSTISYTSFKGYLKDARDSTRLMTIKNIQTGLDSYKIGSGKYPNPEELYGSGTINGIELVRVGKIGDGITRMLRINTTPRDPLSNSLYTYGITLDNMNYQIGMLYEGNQMGFRVISTTYADSLRANVEGNYGNGLRYKIGEDTYYGNIPSIIFSNTGSTNLMGSGTYYIVDNKTNVPYNIDGSINSSIQNINGTQMINELTRDSTTSLTGINITGMTPETIDNYFTGSILKNFSINGQDNTATLQRIKAKLTGNNNVTVGGTTQLANTPLQGCTSTSSGGYTVPNLNDAESITLTKSITNGTGSMNASCSNGVITYGSQNTSCITNYVSQGGACVSDVCQGSAPSNSQSTATSQNAGASWTHTTTPGVCTFVCQVGYYYSGGNCVQASAGYMVGLPGQTSQTACGTGYYQDLTGQSSCKACSNKPSNSTYTVSTALTSNTCPYSCDSGYYGSGGSCLAYVNGSCTGIPSNAQYFNTTGSYTLSGATNGTSLTASYNVAPTSNTCQYKCNSGYYNSGSSCLGYVNGSCTGIPSNAQYYNGTASYSLVNANNGTSLTASYNVVPTSNTCQYKCNSGYYNSGSSCLAYVNGSCTGIPSNAQYYNGTASYSLVNANNGTSLTASYNLTPVINTCKFKCNDGFAWVGGACVQTDCTSDHGYILYDDYTQPSTFVAGPNCSTVNVLAVGGGGGGGLGGGGSGYVKVWTGNISGVVSITVGKGGVGTSSCNSKGDDGGASSFGSYITALGGSGGGVSAGGNGGSGGGGGSPGGGGGSSGSAGISGGGAGGNGGNFDDVSLITQCTITGSSGGGAGDSGGGGGGGIDVNYSWGGGGNGGSGGHGDNGQGYGSGGGGGFYYVDCAEEGIGGNGNNGAVYVER